MTSGPEVPVVLVLFNRVEPLRLVFEQIRAARPRRLLVVADGPRPDHRDDDARCRAARAVVDVDWPCEVAWEASDENLGCDRRLVTGLDWAFDQVDRAIVLEDDVVAHPAFFPWAASMLDRYASDGRVMHVAGRNELGRWSAPAGDHLVVVRGSVWGWATWARAWRGVDRLPAALDGPAVEARLAESVTDPVVHRHLALHLEAARAGTLGAWDVTWSLRRVLAGGLSVAPTANLVRNVGFGPDATRTTRAGDVRGGLPLLGPPPPATGRDAERPPLDPTYDRWALLLDLMSSWRDPRAARRLARAGRLVEQHRPDGAAARHHLAPFDHPADALAAIDHVRAAGSTASYDAAAEELRAVLAEREARR